MVGAIVERITLAVPGRPEPHRRPRAVSRRDGSTGVITAPEDRSYAGRIVDAWTEAGRRRLMHGPYTAVICVRHVRPPSHYLADGVTLSAAGARMPYPRYGDWDSYGRWLDPLVEVGAVPDDAWCCVGLVALDWADRAEMEIRVRTALPDVASPAEGAT